MHPHLPLAALHVQVHFPDAADKYLSFQIQERLNYK